MIVGEPDASYKLREWKKREVDAWVDAALLRGLDLMRLEERELRVACIAEYNRRISEEGRSAAVRIAR